MKKLVLAIALLAGAATYQQADAQISVSFNIGTQPLWGPTGYDYAQYYYMPEMGVYYDIQNRMYYYPNRGRFIGARTLPAQYGRYNLYNTYKVVLNEKNPWLRDRTIRGKYASYGRRHDQGAIRDSRDSRYWENTEHPHHRDWEKGHRNGRDNNRNDGRGNYRDHGRDNGQRDNRHGK